MQLAAILMGPVLMEMMIGVVMAAFIARMMVLNTPITKEEFYVDQVVNGRKCVETLKMDFKHKPNTQLSFSSS